MSAVIAAEWLKHRRTFTRQLVLLAPLGLTLLPLVLALLHDSLRTWEMVLATTYNWWTVLAVPIGGALLAALSAWQDERWGGWRAMRVRPTAPAALFGAKFAVLAIHTLLASLLLMLLTFGQGLVLASGPVPWVKLVTGALLPWVAALPVLALQLWVASITNFAVSTLLGVVGFVVGVATAKDPTWVYVPWAWAVRITVPVLGVHPNGIPLSSGDPLLDLGVVSMAVGLALAATVVVGALGALWITRREVK